MVDFNFEVSNPIVLNEGLNIFQLKSRCKFCGSIGKYYMSARMPYLFIDHSNQLKMFEYFFKHMPLIDYFFEQNTPRNFTKLGTFNAVYKPLNFKPRLHKNTGTDTLLLNHRVEMFFCECWQTTWYYNKASVQNKPEIINRKKF